MNPTPSPANPFPPEILAATADLSRDQARALLHHLVERFGLQDEAMRHFYFHSNLSLPRFSREEVSRAIAAARARFPDAPVYLLTDAGDRLGHPDDTILLSESELADLAPSDSPRAFVCAFESDQKLVEVLALVRRQPQAFFYGASRFYPTARYFHRNDLARAVLLHEAALPEQKFEVADFENLIQAIDITARLSGDYVEIGVYRGRSARTAMHYMQASGIRRTTHLVDVFEGFNFDGARESPDGLWLGTHADTSERDLRRFLGELDGYRIHRLDIIEDELPDTIGAVAVANIDVDLYEAVLAALQKLAPRVVPGGVLVVEDQGHTPALAGAYLALVEFLRSPAGPAFVPIHMASGQMLLVRR